MLALVLEQGLVLVPEQMRGAEQGSARVPEQLQALGLVFVRVSVLALVLVVGEGAQELGRTLCPSLEQQAYMCNRRSPCPRGKPQGLL